MCWPGLTLWPMDQGPRPKWHHCRRRRPRDEVAHGIPQHPSNPRPISRVCPAGYSIGRFWNAPHGRLSHDKAWSALIRASTA